jgi:hypothetical protein
MVYAEKFSQRVLNNLRSRRIHMRGLPRGVRILVFMGYGSVVALLSATALIWYLWIRTSGSLPLPEGAAMAFSSVWFVVGWALVLTGASDCRPPVFLLIFGLLSFQIYILLILSSWHKCRVFSLGAAISRGGEKGSSALL